MKTALPTVLTSRDLAEMAARAGLRLRSDRVAVRVIAALQGRLAEIIPEQRSVLFAITAPIRKPAKTIVALDLLERGRSSDADVHHTADGNRIVSRRLRGVSVRLPEVLGVVHAAAIDPSDVLDVVEQLIRAVA